MLLHAFKAKVSEQEVDRWSRVYRLLPAEAGKNTSSTFIDPYDPQQIFLYLPRC